MAKIQISIHAPREGSDDGSTKNDKNEPVFLSTPPARGATVALTPKQERFVQISIHAPREGSDNGFRLTMQNLANFYPRSPRGERPKPSGASGGGRRISIHAPREGSDSGRR